MRFIKWLGRLLQTQGLLSNKFEKKFISGRPNYVRITKVFSLLSWNSNWEKYPKQSESAAARGEACLGLSLSRCLVLCLGCVVSMRQIGRCHRRYQWHTGAWGWHGHTDTVTVVSAHYRHFLLITAMMTLLCKMFTLIRINLLLSIFRVICC